jgi:hypothetical protein
MITSRTTRGTSLLLPLPGILQGIDDYSGTKYYGYLVGERWGGWVMSLLG